MRHAVPLMLLGVTVACHSRSSEGEKASASPSAAVRPSTSPSGASAASEATPVEAQRPSSLDVAPSLPPNAERSAALEHPGAAGHSRTPSAALPEPSALPEQMSAARAAPRAPRRSAAAAGASYEAWLETTGDYAVGTPGSLLVGLSAKAPYKCNTQYPYKFVLDAPSTGVTYPSSTVRGMHVDGKHASMPIPFSLTSSGSHVVSGTLSFSTCTEDKCLVDKVHLAVTVDAD
jgi:hypothetical protein